MQDTQEDLYVSLGWASQLASFLYSKLLAQAIGSRFPGLSHRCEIWKVDCFARKPVQETIYPLIIQHANGKSSTKSMSFPLALRKTLCTIYCHMVDFAASHVWLQEGAWPSSAALRHHKGWRVWKRRYDQRFCQEENEEGAFDACAGL